MVGLLTGLDEESEQPFGDGVLLAAAAAGDKVALFLGDGTAFAAAPLAVGAVEGEPPPLLVARDAPAAATDDSPACFLPSLRRAIGLTLAAIGLSLLAVSTKMLEPGLAASPLELASDESASPSRIDSVSSPVTLSFGDRAANPTLTPMFSITVAPCLPSAAATSKDSSCDEWPALLFLRCGESHGSLHP